MIEIIPAIDIIDGKCVRLKQGDYSRMTIYGNDPADVAKGFEDNGITRLHVVDLDGARNKRVTNWNALEKIARLTSLVIDFGGGIKTDGDLRIVFESGASMAVAGSIAVTDIDLFREWLKRYGSEKLILGADIRDKKIAVSAWQETTALDLIPFLKEYSGMGVTQVLCTDIARDGMLEGPSFDIYREVMEEVPALKVIASGGISSLDDIWKLEENDVPAVIIGKALYEGKIKIRELKKFF